MIYFLLAQMSQGLESEKLSCESEWESDWKSSQEESDWQSDPEDLDYVPTQSESSESEYSEFETTEVSE
jgi:hypothetical protein